MGKKVTPIKKIEKKKKTVSSESCLQWDLKVHPGLKVFFGYSLYKSGLILRSLMENLHSNILKHDLSAPESGILYVLSTGSVTNQLTLGQDMGIDKATIVKIIDKLEKLKFVKREVDPKDRRSKLVSLTSKGTLVLDKVRAAKAEFEEEIFSSFSKEDAAHLKRLVPQFLEAVMNVKNNT